MARIAILAVLVLVLPDWTRPSENVLLVVDKPAAADEAVDRVIDRNIDREMEIARFYVSRRDYSGALYRLRIVLTSSQTSRHVEEALALLTVSYLAFGIASHAQAAVDVLGRNFPNGHWPAAAHNALKAAGLEPARDENTWIIQIFQ